MQKHEVPDLVRGGRLETPLKPSPFAKCCHGVADRCALPQRDTEHAPRGDIDGEGGVVVRDGDVARTGPVAEKSLVWRAPDATVTR